jgi:hypothetical protein
MTITYNKYGQLVISREMESRSKVLVAIIQTQYVKTVVVFVALLKRLKMKLVVGNCGATAKTANKKPCIQYRLIHTKRFCVYQSS